MNTDAANGVLTSEKGMGRKPKGGRQKVLDEAIQQFSAVGFEGITIRALAEAAGVNHSLITYHFGDKFGLWKAVIEESFQAYRDRLSARIDGLGKMEPETVLKLAIRDFAYYCSEHPELHRIMTIEGRRKSERLVWLVENHLKPLYEGSRQAIEEGQRQGTVKPGDPGRLYYSIIALAGTHFAFAPEIELVTGRESNPAVDIEETIELIHRVIFVD